MKAISFSAILASAAVALVVTVAFLGEVRTPFGTIVLSPLAEKLGVPAAVEALKPSQGDTAATSQPLPARRAERVGGGLARPSLDGVYRWTDAEGRIHYGDRPPANAEVAAFDEQALRTNVVRAPRTVPQADSRTNTANTAPINTVGGDYKAWRVQRCQQVKDQIERIDARMRRPYTAQQGEYYRARRRSLVNERNEYCH